MTALGQQMLLHWFEQRYHDQCDGDSAHEWGVKLQTLDNPGWRLTFDLEETKMHKDAREIYSRADLVAMIRDLLAELERGAAWENADLGSFLEALAAWTSDIDGFYLNRGEQIPEDPSWRMIADMLRAATMYE